MDQTTLAYYNNHAAEIARSYVNAGPGISAYFADAFPPWCRRLLDIGCGSGRDVHILLQKGYEAFGTEPATGLREQALQFFPALQGRLYPHSFPLPADFCAREKFDGLLCSAVLMHIPTAELDAAIASMLACLKSPGQLLVSVSCNRRNLAPDHRDSAGRLFLPFTRDSLVSPFQQRGCRLQQAWENPDSLGRPDISWLTCLLTRP
jgi:SAM-dependent methyltransferase